MATLGADVEELDRVAKRSADTAVKLATARSQIDAAVQSAFWVGSDADGFRSSWQTVRGPQLTRIGNELERVAGFLHKQADEQRKASEGDASTPGGGGPGPGSQGAGPSSQAPPIPSGDANAVRDWWAALTPQQQQQYIDGHPDQIGNRDGIPAAARDLANRNLLDQDLRRLRAERDAGTISDDDRLVLENAETVERYLRSADGHLDPETGRPAGAQLYIYEPGAFDGDGRVAIATGNLDTARHVAVAVPGLGTKTPGMSPGRAQNVYDESVYASGDSVAVLDWVGYDAPSGNIFTSDTAGVVNQDLARDGARLLASDVAGLRDSRLGDPAHLTVVGNSYGSTTSAIAADEFGLEADDLVLTGSPGAGDADNASDLTTGNAHTWVGSASRDFVSQLGTTGWVDPTGVGAAVIPGVELLGNDPAEDDFDANRFQAESTSRGDHINLDDHGRYYDQGSDSLFNVSSIITGNYDDVLGADPRFDPWWGSLQDPEWDRTPTEHTHIPPK